MDKTLRALQALASGQVEEEMGRLSSKSRQHADRAESSYEVGNMEAARTEAAMATMYSTAAVMLQGALRGMLENS